MKKAVIFDLDDTLISEKQYIQSGYRHVAKILSKKININENDLYQKLHRLFEQNSKDVFNRLFEDLDVQYTQNDILELVKEYRSHWPAINFYPDVIPCLEELKRRGIKLGIITDGYAIAQRQKLNALNAHTYFDEIIVTDELGREYWKPHPYAFEIMKGKLGVEFPNMMYVGDNPEKDFYLSEVIPITTARIKREDCLYKDRAYLHHIKETYTIDSLNDIAAFL